jgi:purine-binding chemotaxis protein CheW
MAEAKQMIGFVVGESSFASPLASVHEIVRVPDITPVPDSPAHLVGVMNLRGRIISVIDLRLCLGITGPERSRHSRIIVTESGGTTLGLVVDSASNVFRITAEQIESPAALFPTGHASYVTGIAKLGDRLVVLVDLALLLKQAIAGNGRAIRPATQHETSQMANGATTPTPGAQ